MACPDAEVAFPPNHPPLLPSDRLGTRVVFEEAITPLTPLPRHVGIRHIQTYASESRLDLCRS